MSLVDLEARRKLQYLNDRIELISKTLDSIDRFLKSQQELVSATAGATRDATSRLGTMQEAMEILTSGSHAVSDCITDIELRLQALEGGESADSFEKPLPEILVQPEELSLVVTDWTSMAAFSDSMPHQIFVTKGLDGQPAGSATYRRVD